MSACVQKTGLHCLTHGRGRPMLVLHGGLGWDHTYLRPGLDLLSKSVELIYYDDRGNGRSAEPERWTDVTHATWADDADAPEVLAPFHAVRCRAAAYNHAALHCLPHYDVLPRLREIRTPMLLSAGRHDWVAPEDEADRIATEVAGAQVVAFEESGHFPFLEEPDRFVAAVEQWLARLPDASSAGR